MTSPAAATVIRATKGYDLTSGWGSPNTDGLINALTKK